MVGRRGRARDISSNSASGLSSLPLARKLAYFDGEFERLQRERRLPASRSGRLRVLEPLLRCGACLSPGPSGDGRLALAAGVLLLLLLPGCLLLCGGPATRFLSFCGRVLLIQVCQKYPTVESLQKVDPKVVLQKYLRQNLPLVITDGAEEWVALREFTVPFLIRLFSEHPVLQNTIVCSYWDSHDSLEKSPSAFLGKVHHQRLAQWAIQWKNCNKAAAKVIRGFYQRPYFLPPVVELAESNWLLMASQAENGGTEDKFIKVGDYDGDLLMWIAQLQGVFEIQLLPKDMCASNCTHYTLQLSPGEAVAVPLQMWEVQYRPFSSTAIGIAATGNWLQDSR
ncbi:uncharacterized protein LOC127579401 isoform X2 [Pristis pectinata]|uniref:uncharacterized protein LOC127579401 isoform X2 n=1 Tax=Pristis pectinata TaxID=685728 RepID=UPI00223D7D11|nr:uncharacterized protein LOC127579401 isoform X2 [Pristis pectinata]